MRMAFRGAFTGARSARKRANALSSLPSIRSTTSAPSSAKARGSKVCVPFSHRLTVSGCRSNSSAEPHERADRCVLVYPAMAVSVGAANLPLGCLKLAGVLRAHSARARSRSSPDVGTLPEGHRLPGGSVGAASSARCSTQHSEGDDRTNEPAATEVRNRHACVHSPALASTTHSASGSMRGAPTTSWFLVTNATISRLLLHRMAGGVTVSVLYALCVEARLP
jgi:hypothetical protein